VCEKEHCFGLPAHGVDPHGSREIDFSGGVQTVSVVASGHRAPVWPLHPWPLELTTVNFELGQSPIAARLLSSSAMWLTVFGVADCCIAALVTIKIALRGPPA
jgi:hypothetical protein